MKGIQWIAAAATLVASHVYAQDLSAVKNVDYEQFAGTWYEIAATPSFAQRNCVATESIYTLNKPGELGVENRCRKKSFDGKWTGITGKARPDKTSEEQGRLKLQVFWPFSSDLWILWLDDAYQTSIIGTPDKGSVWILSRERQIAPEKFQTLTAYLDDLGFQTEELKLTRQPQAL